MPVPMLKKYAELAKVPLSKAEDAWERAKKQADGIMHVRSERDRVGKYWALVNGLTKKALGVQGQYVRESFSSFLAEGKKSFLDDKKYGYHSIRRDSDLEAVFKDGLKPGTNISRLDGQAFEDECGTILVIDRSKCKIEGKGYQADEKVVSGDARPVAILKDCSCEAHEKLEGEALDKIYDEIGDRFEKLETIRKNYALTLDLTVEELMQAVFAKDRVKLGELYERAIENARDFDRLYKYMDAVDKDIEKEGKTVDAVLAKYKKFGVPVFRWIPKNED